MATMIALTADHPLLRACLAGWHEDGRARFERDCPSLDYDLDAYAKSAHERRKYFRPAAHERRTRRGNRRAHSNRICEVVHRLDRVIHCFLNG